MRTLLVLTNVPDRAAAERIADLLIEKRLAACVNILACRSVYRWKDAVQHDDEWHGIAPARQLDHAVFANCRACSRCREPDQ